MGHPWKGNGKSYNFSVFDTEISRCNCIWYRAIKYISVYDTGHFYIRRHPTLQSAHCALDRLHLAQVVQRGTSAWAQLIQKQEHVGRLVATTVVKNFVAIIPLLKSVKWTVVPTTAISKCLVVMFGPSWMQIVANTRSLAAHLATAQHIPALNPDTNPPSLLQC